MKTRCNATLKRRATPVLVAAAAGIFSLHAQWVGAAAYTYKGGNNNWDQTTTSWTTLGSPSTTWADNTANTAVIGPIGLPGTLTLTGSRTTGGISVTNSGFTLAGGKTLIGNISLSTGVTLTLAPGNLSGGTIDSVNGVTSASLNLLANPGAPDATRMYLANGATIASNVGITISTQTGTGVGGFIAGGSTGTIVANITNNSGVTTMLGALMGNTLKVYGDVTGSSGLQISAGANGGDGSVALFRSLSYTGNTILNSTGTLYLNVNNTLPKATTLLLGKDDLSGKTGTIDFNGFDQTVAALMTGTINAGTGVITSNGAVGITNVLTVNGSTSPGTFYGSIQNGTSTVAFARDGSGTTSMAGANSYTGGTSLTGGHLVLDFGAATATTSNILSGGSSLTLGGGSLLLRGKADSAHPGTQQLGTVVLSAGHSTAAIEAAASGTPAITFSGTITRNTGATLDLTVSGAGGGAFYATNNLPANSTFLGGWVTLNNSDWVQQNSTGLLSTLTGLTTSNSASNFTSSTGAQYVTNSAGYSGTTGSNAAIKSLRFNFAGSSNFTIADTLIINSGGILVTPTVAGNASIVQGGAITSGIADLIIHQHNTGNTLSIASKVTGAVALTKAGAGTLVLTNDANDFNGNTYINAGRLKLNPSSATNNNLASSPKLRLDRDGTLDVSGITAAGGFKLAANQTLAGFGAVNGPFTADASGSVVAPGDTGANGALSFTSDFKLAAGATLQIELSGSSAGIDQDQVVVGSSATTVNVNGASLQLLHLNGFVPPAGRTTTYTILKNDSAQPITGLFAGLSEGASIVVGAGRYSLSYFGGDGNDAVLTSVPEPTMVAAMMGFAMLIFRRRPDRTRHFHSKSA